MGKRVLHILDSLEPEAGSAAVSLRGLPEALDARAIHSDVKALNGSRNAVPDAPSPAEALEQADIVHFHGWGPRAATQLAALAGRKRKPYIISPMGALSDGPYVRTSLGDRLRTWLSGNRAVRRAATIVAVNEHEKQPITSRGLHDRVITLPLGIRIGENETITHDGLTGANGAASVPSISRLRPGRIVLVLGPIHPVEGLVPFLKAFAELGPATDGWNIVIAGAEIGEWRKQLEAAVNRKDGDDRVAFTTASDPAAQYQLLRQASLLAVPSLQPRCPVSILQAVASGVPVLATHYVTPSGVEDVVRVCAPARGELRSSLSAMFEMSDQQRSAMADRARDAARTRWDWSVLADRYADLYESL